MKETNNTAQAKKINGAPAEQSETLESNSRSKQLTKETGKVQTTKPNDVKKASENKKTDHKHMHKISKQTVSFTIFVVAWAILATTIAQYLTAWPMVLILGSKVNQPSWMLLYYVLTYALSLVLVILVPLQVLKLYRKRHAAKANTVAVKNLESDLEVTANDMGVQNLPTFVDIGLAPVGYIVYIVLASILTTLMSVFVWFNANEAQDVGFGYYITDIDRICAMLAVVFIAPLAEELIMRGWLYGKLRRKWGIIVAMLLTSLAFAVMHGQWNVGVSVFALSIVLCTLREITGTIWSGILLHMLSNGIAFYLLYVAV